MKVNPCNNSLSHDIGPRFKPGFIIKSVVFLTLLLVLASCSSIDKRDRTWGPYGASVEKEHPAEQAAQPVRPEPEMRAAKPAPVESAAGPQVEPEPEIQAKPAPEPPTGPDICVFDIPDKTKIQEYYDQFTGPWKQTFERWLERSRVYLPMVRQVFEERGLPMDLALLPFAESGFNPFAYSRAGAAGMWQFMPGTARKYGLHVDWWIDQRRDPYLSTIAAADYLSDLYEMFGDWNLALAGYNAGEGKVSRAIRVDKTEDFFEMAENGRVLRRETRSYVPKFMALLKIVRNLEELGYRSIDWDREFKFAMVELPGGTDLLALAKACDMSWNEFKQQNPAFRRQVTPPDMTTIAYIPVELSAKAEQHLAQAAESRPHAGYSRYRVRSGDSWWRISNRFGVPISVLKRINNRSSNLLRPGQWVIVPVPSSTVASSAPASTPREETRRIAQQRGNYIVRPGDTLWDLSQMFGVSIETLKQANGLASARSLRAGQKLYIPDRGEQATREARREAREAREHIMSEAAAEKGKPTMVSYLVRKGDTLWDIARQFGVTTEDLKSWNNLPGNARIYPGDEIKVYVD